MIKRYIFLVSCLALLYFCQKKLPVIHPVIKTEKVPHDSDDPAIWVNKAHPEQSIVFGTDKDLENGGVYAFDLSGKILKDKSIIGLSYPNNIDVEYGFKLSDSTQTDILVFTEREKHQIRVFALPDMKAIDRGGFKVFEDESQNEMKRPMGVSLYKNPKTENISIIVSRKKGPKDGYLHQYKLFSDTAGVVKTQLIRKFGTFSGNKEIEAIAVDDKLGYVYYSDEGVGIRKYYANPLDGNKELSVFGSQYFKDDIEGIAIVDINKEEGYIIVSNQQDNSFNIFSRKTDQYIKKLNLGTSKTDGCEAVSVSLGKKFPKGLLVTMNDKQNFFFHSLDSLPLN
ncbi:MAG: phytase [Tenacibaculum sp.]